MGDVANSVSQCKFDKLPIWEMFFKSLFPQSIRSGNMIGKYEIIFQIVFNFAHSCRKKLPVHNSISKGIHDKCRSKQLIQVLNKLGLCIS